MKTLKVIVSLSVCLFLTTGPVFVSNSYAGLSDLDPSKIVKKGHKEAKRAGKKVHKEAKRTGKKVHKEAKRTGKKIKKEMTLKKTMETAVKLTSSVISLHFGSTASKPVVLETKEKEKSKSADESKTDSADSKNDPTDFSMKPKNEKTVDTRRVGQPNFTTNDSNPNPVVDQSKQLKIDAWGNIKGSKNKKSDNDVEIKPKN